MLVQEHKFARSVIEEFSSIAGTTPKSNAVSRVLLQSRTRRLLWLEGIGPKVELLVREGLHNQTGEAEMEYMMMSAYFLWYTTILGDGFVVTYTHSPF